MTKEMLLIVAKPILFIVIWLIAVNICEIMEAVKEDKKNAKENKQLDIWEHF